jgi:hypothetical protein
MFKPLDKRNLAKIQFLLDPSQYSGNKVKNIENIGYLHTT